MKTNRFVIGILAHVDSGKTTLAESMLFQSGSIRKLGRVDHKDTFLDTYTLERERGITIFSKQARLNIGNKEICLLDTPGHVDFSAEMERTLQVLDYAILLISGADGVQGHTQTLWRILKRYHVPVFIFVNKMDQPGTEKEQLLSEIQSNLDGACIDFSSFREESTKLYDTIAMCDEELMDTYIANESLSVEDISNAINRRKIFPCFFGSALKQEGVCEFMEALGQYMSEQEYPDVFGARVYKIARDEQNNRLTYMKITGGSLKSKTTISTEQWSEKVDQIRIYSGSQYKTVTEVMAGNICAVTGLSNTFSGEGLGLEGDPEVPVLEPVLNYEIVVPDGVNVHDFYRKLCMLEEEEPNLHIVWNEQLNEIHAKVMGEVQIEILKSLISERFHVEVEFGAGNIVYKETIKEPVVGIGHFEPLRHYAEVHLLLEPLERGSGIEYTSMCSEDILDKNWQRLILTHLEEKNHPGVLTGSEVTDIRISLIAGRAHQKHTEGGDFRQATYRAVRNGMKKSQSILLEPVYDFRLEVPQEFIGRAMNDIQRRYGTFSSPCIENDLAVMSGSAPVATMQNYQMEVNSYTHGRGRIFCTYKGYEECHNADEVIARLQYDSETDINNPTGSVFCSHGAGFYVEWDKVAEYAHVDNRLTKKDNACIEDDQYSQDTKRVRSDYADAVIAQEEIDEIFDRTFGSIKKKRSGWSRTITPLKNENYRREEKPYHYEGREEYLLVDGYNIIFAWDELKKLSEKNIDSARDKLLDIMCNYQGYKNIQVIVVFDAYKVHGGQGAAFDYHNIHVVYTKEAETADQYIERFTNDMGKKYNITVATSDRLEQMIVWGQGARRLSASGLWEEIEQINSEIRTTVQGNREHINNRTKGNYLLDNVSDDVSRTLDEIKTRNAD